MGDRTDHEAELSREEAADELERLAHELRGDGTAEISVGNKLLTLSPSSTLDYEIDVEERSPLFSGNRETVTLTLDWKAEKPAE